MDLRHNLLESRTADEFKEEMRKWADTVATDTKTSEYTTRAGGEELMLGYRFIRLR